MLMNGIDALKALRDGKTLIRYRRDDHSYDTTNAYFRLDFKYSYDELETSKCIWTKFVCENYWHECSNSVKFWLFADNFEIVEDVM